MVRIGGRRPAGCCGEHDLLVLDLLCWASVVSYGFVN